MYRIQCASLISKETLAQRRDYIITDMLVNISDEMYRNKCFEITETNVDSNTEWINPDKHEIRLETFVMTPDEFREVMLVIKLIKNDKDILPEYLNGYISHIYSILTKPPINNDLQQK